MCTNYLQRLFYCRTKKIPLIPLITLITRTLTFLSILKLKGQKKFSNV